MVPIIFTPKVVGEEKRLQWWPGKPNAYGKNPHKKPLYRVIWSESRTYMLGGMWPSGDIEYRWVPYYGQRKEWVLEKWLAPEEFCGSEDTWKQEQIDYGLASQGIVMYTMGPYPKHGWYEHCYSFPENAPPNMDAIVPILESSKSLTLGQIKAGLNLWHEKKRKEWEQKVEDGILDAMPAFHGNPTNIAPSKPHGDSGGLLLPGQARAEVAKFRGDTQQAADVELESPNPRGMSIRQRKG